MEGVEDTDKAMLQRSGLLSERLSVISHYALLLTGDRISVVSFARSMIKRRCRVAETNGFCPIARVTIPPETRTDKEGIVDAKTTLRID